MRSVLARYPSSIYQAALLTDAGFDVWICDLDDGGHAACSIPEKVERRILERSTDLYAGTKNWQRLLSPLRRQRFHRRLKRVVSEIQPDIVISYDPPALATMTRLFPEAWPFLHVWHCHEAAIETHNMGWGTRRDIQLAKRSVGRADFMILPDRHRADVFFGEANLRHSPFIVMNCPRRVTEQPNPHLRELLRSSGVGETTGIVLYFGSVGPGHGLEKAISSMRLWPLDSVLVLAGPTPASYRATLQQSAMQSGIGNRLIFMGTISPEMAWGVRAGADVALTIMDTSHPIYRYCAGASNKRFEAMAAGVAQVTNDGPGIDELFVNRGVLVSAPYDNSERIGSAVADLLTNAGRRREMAAKARHLHLTDYNYEKQFAPVLAELCERISAKPSERN